MKFIKYPTNDLTVLYITANLIPDSFAEYQRNVLLKSMGDAQLVSISRKPIQFGNNIIDNEPKSTDNIFRQMFIASKIISTKYVVVAEDDTLYCPDHFTFCRPPDDAFVYNMNRLALFTWGNPKMYSWRNRVSNAALIAPTLLMREALEERFAKWPNPIPEKLAGELGRGMIERNLGVTVRKLIEAFSEISIVQFNHDFSSEHSQRVHTKMMGHIKAYSIPYWGEAEELVRKFV